MDAAEQFANAYGYANNPVIMIDPDGNFVFTTFLAALGIGAAIGAGVSAASYSISVAATGGDWNFKDFIKQVGLGALGGAVTGGFGSIGGSVATNMFYSAIGNGVSYGLTSAITGNEMSAGGFGAALLGGLAGGLMPSYGGLNNLAGGALAKNAFRSIGGEIAYGATKGALMGGLSSTIETGSFKNFGKGAAMVALSGAVGTGAGMAYSGRIYNTGYEKNLATYTEKRSNSLWAPGFRKGGISMALAQRKDPKIAGAYDGLAGMGSINIDVNNESNVAHEFKHYMDATNEGAIQQERNYWRYHRTVGYQNNPYEIKAYDYGSGFEWFNNAIAY